MRIIIRAVVCLGLWLVPILARGQQNSPPVLPSNLYTTLPSGSSGSSGVVGKVFNATDAAYGLSAANSAAQNNTALTALATAVNAYTGGTSPQDRPVVYIPGGSPAVNATYAYSGGLVFTRPVTILCGEGAMLNYTGSAHAADFGPTGLVLATLTESAAYSQYVVDGCGWTGGASMTQGLFFNQYIFTPMVKNNTFYNFGNSTSTVFGIYINPNISGCQVGPNNSFFNEDNVARNALRVDASTGFSDQCHVFENRSHNQLYAFGSIGPATNIGVLFWVDGQGSIVELNNLNYCAPCIRVGPGPLGSVNGTRLTHNYMEGPVTAAVTTPMIQYGDPGSATFVDSLFIIGNFIFPNNSANVIMGPASVTTGLTNAMFANNRIGSTFTGPVIQQNNVAGQVGNSFWDDIGCSGNNQCLPLNIGAMGVNTQWAGPNYPIFLPDGAAATPIIARSTTTTNQSTGLRFVGTADQGMEFVHNSTTGAGYVGVSGQSASSAYSGLYAMLAADPANSGTYPNSGFWMRHYLNSTLSEDAMLSFENGRDLSYYTTTTGTTTKKFTIQNTGSLALGAAGLHGTMFISQTAPTIAVGGCGGAAAAISGTPNGTAAFAFSVGTTPTATCTLTMPTATTAWVCDAFDFTSPTTAGGYLVKENSTSTTTSLVLVFFNNAGASTAPTASDVVRVKCMAY